MNFQQLRIIREAVRCNYNLTEVGSALFTSQSGVSKHIKDLEDELGVELFVRKGKRLLDLTDPGRELLQIVERILLDANNIKNMVEQYSQRDEGQLTVVATHTQARYALPKVITDFKKTYPKVHLKLHQASPNEIVTMLLSGEADIGMATEALADVTKLDSFPFYTWHHAVIVPVGHPLEQVKPLTLQALAEYPIVTYHEGLTGRAKIDQAFLDAGVTPDISMSALDSDVIKTYVELGLGIGIIASMAFNPAKDSDLRLLQCEHLFGVNTTYIALRRGHYLRSFAYRFIELCSPKLDEAVIRAGISPSSAN
ncbi:CysB family HTH-type transcriptional regulator [Gallionella capsiferriformans]|uniref:Transcriptional regulator, LysR family n=1 Tax=Gallionella capsiferriformans (strain ES-2) TaxID=395494 RepID=D9SHD3_GALCS|nr:CysB family HTH-type transcriptional regulator [Gallionella capsiferriformans]ADL55930.1 transcriptional regulator, LysR family [Gallionella capsiferriformans ES-2]